MGLWYEKGLRFECKRCGDCCRGEPGYVWVTLEEAADIARTLGMSMRDFEAACLRRVGARMSLLERPDGDCIFWEENTGCGIYHARPRQCRTFPFWSENIRGREAWQSAAQRCRGIDRGRLYTENEIREQAGRTS